MKKVFALFAIVGMFTFVSCGPKAEEPAADATEEVMEEAAPEAVIEEVIEAAPADSLATPAATTPQQ